MKNLFKKVVLTTQEENDNIYGYELGERLTDPHEHFTYTYCYNIIPMWCNCA